MKSNLQKSSTFGIVNCFIIFNFYLLYQTIFSNYGVFRYFAIKEENAKKEEIYRKNNKEINSKIDLLNLSNINSNEGSDVFVEFIKKNYDYKVQNEKIIIIR